MKTNALIYRTEKTAKNGEQYIIKICLDDQCKNGHQDFSITGDIYEPNKTKCERNMISGGAIGDKIGLNFPEFDIFNKLHLCDFEGSPMYPSANGLYHLIKGFDHLEGKTQKQYFCDYYRMTSKQYDIICKSENELEFSILLDELGILKQWLKQAKEAIKKLEKLTGDEFLNDSIKTQHKKPSKEAIKKFQEKKKAGYYSDANKKKRAIEEKKQKKAKKISSIIEDFNKEVKKLETSKKIKLFMIEKELTDNFIYYTHSNTIKFNWVSYEKQITEKEFDKFCNSLTEANYNYLPIGIEFELNGVKRFSNH